MWRERKVIRLIIGKFEPTSLERPSLQGLQPEGSECEFFRTCDYGFLFSGLAFADRVS